MSDDRHTKYWQRARLAALAGKLPPEWEAQYQALIAELGPQSDEPNLPRSGWVGPTSPWTKDVLAAWSPKELAAELRRWQPKREWDAPTPEGIARLISELVEENAARYADEAAELQGLQATYVRSALEGFSKAVKAGRVFAWRPVLALCRWLETQADPANADPTGTGDEDPHWGWARREVASLLSAGFESTGGGIPIDYCTLAWDVLAPLTNDPEPSPEYEASNGGDNMGPLTLSINTVRGEALHTVMRYCLWVYRAMTEAAEPNWRGLASVPEARAALELHLDLKSDRSLAIRAVYGQWLPWLALMDSRWVELSLETLFPRGAAFQAHRDAAWDSYVTMNRLYRNVFDLARNEYERAVDEIDHSRPVDTKLYEAPDVFVARHVVVAYLLGWIELDAAGLVARLFAKAPEDIRVEALEFVGRVLGEETEPELVERAQLLWEWERARPPSAKELAAFGWWYQTGKTDEAWALAQLVACLEETDGHIDMDHGVAERLAASAGPLAHRLRAFELLIQGAPSHSWEIGAWATELRAVLTAAVSDASTAARARAVTGRVIAKGYPAFADLLKEQPAGG